MDWTHRAACRDMDPELFFGDDDSATKPGPTPELFKAIKVCEGCGVREICLLEGMHEDYGVWGGRSPSARRKMRRAG